MCVRVHVLEYCRAACVRVCVCVRMYGCVWVCLCLCTHVRVHVRACAHTCTHPPPVLRDVHVSRPLNRYAVCGDAVMSKTNMQ